LKSIPQKKLTPILDRALAQFRITFLAELQEQEKFKAYSKEKQEQILSIANQELGECKNLSDAFKVGKKINERIKKEVG